MAGVDAGAQSNVYLLGKSVYTTYLFPFEATAALLIIAVVGAVVLARRPRSTADRSARPTDAAPVGERGATESTEPAPGRRRGRPRRPRPRLRVPPEPAGAARGGPGMTINPDWYLALSVVLFAIGALGVLIRRNVLVMLMCVELMLNAANLSFVTFARMLHDIGGQVLVFFVLVVAAAEVVVGLGIVVAIFRRRANATADDLHLMKG